DGPQGPANSLDAPAQQAPLRGYRKVKERFRLNQYNFGGWLQILRFETVQFRVPVVFFAASPDGRRREYFDQRRIQARGEFRQMPEPDAIARELRIEVRAVFPPGE